MKTTNEQLNDYNESIKGRMILESSNSILVIHPYYDRGMWVFDDERVGLSKEPFVAGADQFIEYGLHKMGKLKEGKKGFNMVFSVIPFKDFDYELNFIQLENMGSVYEIPGAPDFRNRQGENQIWLCPALNLYFKNSPEKIYAAFNV
jgi:hypothetical protein